jgi:choloylglycine hydrolase
VATNSPPFDWHLTNLRNYVNQSAMDVPALVIDGKRVAPLGEGTGMLGLPGDFTPPSRFVRAVAFSASARVPDTVAGGVNAAMHLLSSFDIAKGVVRDPAPSGVTDVQGDGLGDYTCYRSVSELGASPAYTLLTYDDAAQRRIVLQDINLREGPVRSRPLLAQPPVPTIF